jgi:hypothetical protein
MLNRAAVIPLASVEMGPFQAKEGYSATTISVALTNPEGQTQRYEVIVTAKPAPAGSAPTSPKPPTGNSP